MAFAPLRKTDLSQFFYLSAQIQFRLKTRHIFNIFGLADQYSIEKTFHPFFIPLYRPDSAGPALLFQALSGRERPIEQHRVLQRARCQRVYVVWHQRWIEPF